MSQTLGVSANGIPQESDTRAELGMQTGYWGVTHVKGTGRKLDWAGRGIRFQHRSNKVSISPTGVFGTKTK